MSKDKSSNHIKKHIKDASIIDFYQVLGIENKKASINEIKKKYVKLAIKYHPDKNPDSDTGLFELIQRAWECLSNEEKRKEYDGLFNNIEKSKKSDFVSLKKGFDDYKELSKNDIKTKESAQFDFNKGWDEINNKRGFDPKQMREAAISVDDAKKRISDMMLERESDEIEFAQNKIFDDKNWNLGKFNAVFELYKKSSEDKSGGELITAGNPSAFNAIGESSFTNINNMNDPYDEDTEFEGNTTFGSVNFGSDNKLRIDEDKIRNLEEVGYTSEHNKLDDNYSSILENKLRERELETANLSKIAVNEFKNTPKDAYMFTHEFPTTTESLSWDNNDLIEAHKKLIDFEKKK